MILSSQLRPGMAIRFENHTYRVLAADYHSGQGKMGGSCHARLRDIATGTQWEHAFRADLKLEDLPVEKLPYTFVYRDGEDCFLMDPNTFEQISLPASVAGSYADFFEPDLPVTVEFVDGKPVGVLAPDVIEAVIADTAPPIHGSDQVWKPANLANGVSVMVPPFIKSGDAIRIDLATRRYMDRAKPPTVK
ncbi:MAG: hypothetical protein JNN08_28565 [Bryobacterales bacterium]|nr:hypothetical protein [Bryobacterales bacterium]